MRFYKDTVPVRQGFHVNYSAVPYVNDVWCRVDSSEKRRKVKAAFYAGDEQPPLCFYADTLELAVKRLEYHLKKMGHEIINP